MQHAPLHVLTWPLHAAIDMAAACIDMAAAWICSDAAAWICSDATVLLLTWPLHVLLDVSALMYALQFRCTRAGDSLSIRKDAFYDFVKIIIRRNIFLLLL